MVEVHVISVTRSFPYYAIFTNLQCKLFVRVGPFAEYVQVKHLHAVHFTTIPVVLLSSFTRWMLMDIRPITKLHQNFSVLHNVANSIYRQKPTYRSVVAIA